MELLVNIGGQVVPLERCTWVFFKACGCPFGLMVGDEATSEEQARKKFRKDMHYTKREFADRIVKLMTRPMMEADSVWDKLKTPCSCGQLFDAAAVPAQEGA